VIRDAAEHLRPGAGIKRWLSPKFEAAGAHGLQLEIRIPPADDANVERDELQPLPDGCAVYVWAGESGLRLVCKLYIGSVYEQFEHTFDGVAPCGTQHFNCSLRDQIHTYDNTLRVGVELLEAIREVKQLPRVNAAPEPPGPGRKDAIELSDASLVFHRHLCHRTLELVQTQVDLMNSRMVRRIEWRLDNASLLRRCFPEGQSLCSTKFEAAGVGNLQLVFYPSGYQGAKEGYCSYFLCCPGGSALKCWLLAGNQRREAKLVLEEAGFFGRTNFCRFDSCVEPADDSLLLVLEIDEAQASTTEWMWHQPTQANVSTMTPDGDLEASDSLIEHSVASSIKLKRTPGRAALEDVKRLPSVWTSQPHGQFAEALDGYHSFGDLKALRKPGTASSRQPIRPAGSPAKVAPRYMMYAVT
jgi:hypothetical protein